MCACRIHARNARHMLVDMIDYVDPTRKSATPLFFHIKAQHSYMFSGDRGLSRTHQAQGHAAR